MTEPGTTPVTRRELRRAEQRRTGQVPHVVTRRELRQAANPAAPRVEVPRALRAASPAAAAVTTTPTATPGTPAAAAARTLTRRELRTAGRSTCQQPFAVVPMDPAATSPLRTEHRPGTTRAQLRASSRGRRRAPGRRPLLTPVAASVVAAALLTAGVGQAHREHQARAAVDAQLAAALLESDRQARHDLAASSRLTAQAAAHLAEERGAALDVALAAVQGADEVVRAASPVLDEAELTPLDQALSELTAMIRSTPEEVVLGPGVPETAGATDTTGAPDPDVERSDAPSRAASRLPVPEADASDTVEHELGSIPAADGIEDGLPAPAVPSAPGSRTSDEPTLLDAEDPAVSSADATTVDAPVVDEEDHTTRLLAAAELVQSLSAQVQATADEVVAAAEAEAAAAAELERLVRMAEEAPNGRIPAEALCDVPFAEGALLRCDAAAALVELNEAYRAAMGRDLRVVSSYRSYDGQVAVKRTRGSLAATPGTSNHGRGLAVDFGGFGSLGNFSTANYRWMKENAGRFGWHHPRIMQPGGGGPQEPWHWEYGTE